MMLKSNKCGNALPPKKKSNNLAMKSTATDSEELSSSDAEILAQIAAIKAENEALKRDLQAKVSTVKKTKSAKKRKMTKAEEESLILIMRIDRKNELKSLLAKMFSYQWKVKFQELRRVLQCTFQPIQCARFPFECLVYGLFQ